MMGYGTEAIRNGSDGRSVETDRSVDSPGQVGRATTRTRDVRGGQRHSVCRANGLFVAAVAARFAAVGDGLSVFSTIPA